MLRQVTFELDAADPKLVNNVVVTVFDTIPPANSICITRTGIPYIVYTVYNCMYVFMYVCVTLTVRLGSYVCMHVCMCDFDCKVR